MATCVVAFAIDPAALWSIYGSNDQSLIERVRAECSTELDKLTEDFGSKAPDGLQTLANFVAGVQPHMAWVHHNVRIIELLLTVLGERLANKGWERVDAGIVDQVQRLLTAAEVPLDLARALRSGPPATIPTFNPYTRVGTGQLGFVSSTDVASIAPALSRVSEPRARSLAAAVAGLRRWFDHAASRNTGLVLMDA